MFIDAKRVIRRISICFGPLALCLGAAAAFAAPGDPLTAPMPVIDAQRANERPLSPEVTVDQAGQIVVAWDRATQPGRLATRRFSADLTPLSGTQIVDPSSTRPNTDSSARNFVAIAANAAGLTVAAYTTPVENPPTMQAVFARMYGRDGGTLTDLLRVAVQNEPDPRPLSALLPRFRTGGTGGYPAVAVNAAGEFVVSWAEDAFVGRLVGAGAVQFFSSRVMARRYFRDGTPVADAVVLARRGPEPLFSLNGLQSVVRVLATPDDRFAVIYSGGTADGPVLGLRSPFSLQYVGRDGRPQGLPRALETYGDRSLAITESDFHAAYTTSGDLLLTWVTEDARDDFSGPQEVVVRRYSAAGVPRGAPVRVAGRTQFNNCCSVRVVPMSNGASAVLWVDAADGCSVQGRYFAADLSPLGEPFVLVTGSTEAGAVADVSGNLLVAYGAPETTPPPRQLFLRRFQGP